jgi:hypothetical protein
LAGVYKKYESQGLHIIGIECQNTPADQIAAMCKGKGVGYQVTINGQLKGSTGNGIPQGYLFGADGKFVCEVHPSEVEAKIKVLLKDVAAAMAGPGPYVKLASLAAQVKAGQNLGGVLKTLRAKKDSKDEAEAKEAAMMFAALGGGAQDKLDRAMAMKTSDPAGAVARLEKLLVQFSGDDIGAKAKVEADELKKDPKVRKEIEGEAMYAQLEILANNMKPFNEAKNPKAEGFRKMNAAAISSLLGGCMAIAQRYPDTQAAKKANTLMEQYKQ